MGYYRYGVKLVNNTNINYPIVQTTNNDYYLNHAYDKTKNMAGWLFADYRNNMDDIDKNTIIFRDYPSKNHEDKIKYEKGIVRFHN